MLILTLLSFVPQIRLFSRRRDCRGISLIYALTNLISATEQFAINSATVVFSGEPDDIFVHEPMIANGWLNLCQTGLVWVLFLV
ncbi:hypothetical protein BDV06DRAFT_181632 [Aspergillus oleicola]